MSANGRFVTFVSNDEGIAPGDRYPNDPGLDTYLRDMQSGSVQRVSVPGGGRQGGGGFDSLISANGRYVVFDSQTVRPISPDLPNEVFVRDLQNDTTRIVSVNSAGAAANTDANLSSMTPDGRYIVFGSFATNLDRNASGQGALFVRDRQLGTTRLVSLNSGGAPARGISYNGSLSDNGRYLIFISTASNLSSDDHRPCNEPNVIPCGSDAFLRDLATGRTQLVSLGRDGQANGDPSRVTIGPNGHFIGLLSNADNLVLNDTNQVEDVFLRGPFP